MIVHPEKIEMWEVVAQEVVPEDTVTCHTRMDVHEDQLDRALEGTVQVVVMGRIAAFPAADTALEAVQDTAQAFVEGTGDEAGHMAFADRIDHSTNRPQMVNNHILDLVEALNHRLGPEVQVDAGHTGCMSQIEGCAAVDNHKDRHYFELAAYAEQIVAAVVENIGSDETAAVEH